MAGGHHRGEALRRAASQRKSWLARWQIHNAEMLPMNAATRHTRTERLGTRLFGRKSFGIRLSSQATAARQRDKWGFVPPGAGAESYAMLMERVRPVFEELSRPTVCVTHGGVIRTLFRMVENLSANEAAALEIVQDRVLKLENSRLEWL